MEPQEELPQGQPAPTESGAAPAVDTVSTPSWRSPHRHPWIRKGFITLVVVGVALVLGFSLVYAGKIYPGVSVDGVYLGGLSRAEAITTVNNRLATYRLESIGVQYQNVNLRILPFKLGLEYNVEAAVDLAMQQGRQKIRNGFAGARPGLDDGVILSVERFVNRLGHADLRRPELIIAQLLL